MTDDFNASIVGDASGETFDTRFTISDDDMYLYFKASDGSDNVSTYIYSKHENSDDSVFNINTLLTPNNIVESLEHADKYKVIYNCRTKIDDVLYDDIIVRLDALTIIQLLVEPNTGNVAKILTPCFSNNDYTDILYDEPVYSKMNFDDLVEYKNQPNTTLPDGNKGNAVTLDEFYVACDFIFRLCTNDNITLIDDTVYDAFYNDSTESEENNSAK